MASLQGKHPIHRIDRVKATSLDSLETFEATGQATGNSAESSARRLKQGTGKLIKFVQDKIGVLTFAVHLSSISGVSKC